MTQINETAAHADGTSQPEPEAQSELNAIAFLVSDRSEAGTYAKVEALASLNADLLAALKQLVQDIEDNERLVVVPMEIYLQARDAIARAEGQRAEGAQDKA